MKDKVLFYEKQQFRQWWIWLLIIGTSGFAYYKHFLKKEYTFDEDPTIWIPIAIWILVLILFWFMKLETFIYEDRIEINFSPIHRKNRIYLFTSISKMEVIKYNPILDYGGWGIRIGAYNISGNKGLKIHFKTKKSLLIGTQKPEELSKIINSIHNV